MSTKFARAAGLMVILAGIQSAWAEVGERWQVNRPVTMLRAGPGTDNAVINRLLEGTLLVEQGRSGDWVQVSVPDSGDEGWIFGPLIAPAAAETVAAVEAAPALTATPAAPERVHRYTLAELGHTGGLRFTGADDFVVRFPLPRDTAPGSARLHLALRAGPGADEAVLRIAVDGVTHRQLRLGELESAGLELPLTPVPGAGSLELSLAGLPPQGSGCPDERLPYLEVLPDSALELTLAPALKSLRDAWALLPHPVTLSLPDGSDPALFTAAWRLSERLYAAGHTVQVARLPTIGQLALGPRERIAAALSARFGDRCVRYQPSGERPFPQLPGCRVEAPRFIDFPAEGNLALINTPAGPLMALTEPFEETPYTLLGEPWAALAAADSYRLSAPGDGAGEAGTKLFPLSRFGLDGTQTAREWRLRIGAGQLPPGTRPDKLNLSLVAPPGEDGALALHVLLNGQLVRAAPLAGSGQRQTLTVELPPELLDGDEGVQLSVRRGDGDDCAVPAALRLSDDSSLSVAPERSVPARFSDLRRHYAGGYGILLPRSWLGHPEAVLPALAALTASHGIPLERARVSFLDGGEQAQLSGPFLAVGDLGLPGARLPLAVEDEAVRMAGVLRVGQLPELTVAQVARVGSAYGLWVYPAEGAVLAPLAGLFERRDDLAFADASGVLFSLDSQGRAPAGAQAGWQSIWEEHRGALLAGVWLALTLAILLLYRRSRRRNARR